MDAGTAAPDLPAGSGMFLEPGTFLVNQIHYHYDHETPPDQSVIVIDTFSAEELGASSKPRARRCSGSVARP